MRNDSNWTGRTLRTLQESRLGPYASFRQEKVPRSKAIYRLIPLILILLLLLLIGGFYEK